MTESIQDEFEALRTFLSEYGAKVKRKHRPKFHDALERLERLSQALQEGDEQARLAMLYDVSRALGSSLQLDKVLHFAMDAVIELTGAERGFLMLTHPETGALDLMVARNIQRKTLDQEDMQVSHTFIQQVIEHGAGIVTTNAQVDERFADKDSVVMYALRSILCVPLRTRGKIIGVLYVDNKVKSGVFDESDRETLEAFATQAAAAIDNARLYTRTDAALTERVEELELLQRIDRDLNARIDFSHVTEITLNWAIHGTRAQRGWISLKEAESDTMRIVAGDGEGSLLNLESLHLQPGSPPGSLIRKEGGEEFRELLVAPVRREDQIIACIGVIRTEDIFSDAAVAFLQRLAAHAAAAIENTRLYQAVQEANLAKSRFVSAVSHELRVPMTSIHGYADLILKGKAGPVTEKQAKYLDNIRANVTRMSTLVSDLSDVSRIETGQLQVQFSQVPLAKYIRETASNLKPLLDAKHHSLQFDLPENLPEVWTDRTRLVQILTNLISNAIKYTPEGGEIEIGAAGLQVGKVKVSVSDNGIGISDEELKLLFHQFFRSEHPLVREQAGWGLGLHVTRRLIELLDGEIGVESKPEEGSRFWFTLPVADPSSSQEAQ